MVDTTQADRAVNTYKQSLTTLAAPTNTITANMQKMNQQFAASVNPIKQQGNALATLNTNLKTTQTQAVGLGTKIKTTAGQFAGFATGLSATATGVLQLGAGFRDYNDAQIAVERQQRKLSLATEAQHKAQDKLDKLTKAGVKSGKAYEQAQLDVTQANQQLSIMTQLLGERQEDMFDAQSQFVASVIPVTLGAVGTLGSAFKDLGLNMTKIKSVFSTVGTGATGLITKLAGIGGGASGAAGGLGILGKGGTGVTGIFGKLKGVITGIIPGLLGLGTQSGTVAKSLGNVGVQGTGVTGMFGKFKAGLNSAAGAIGLTTTGLIGMSAALGGVVLGVVELDKQMKLAQWAHEFDAAGGASHRSIEQLRVDLQNAKSEASSWGNQLKTAFQAMDFTNIFKKPDDLAKQLNFMDDVVKSIEQTLNRKEGIKAYQEFLASILASDLSPRVKANVKGIIDKIVANMKNDFNFAAHDGATAQQSTDYTEAVVAGLEANLDEAMGHAQLDTIIEKNMKMYFDSAAAHAEGLTGSLKEAFLKANPFANVGGEQTQLFAQSGKAISAGVDKIGILYKQAMAKLAPKMAASFTGETKKAFDKVTAPDPRLSLTGMTKAFAFDPKPIAKTGDEIGKLSAKVLNFSATAKNATLQEDAWTKAMLADKPVIQDRTKAFNDLVVSLKGQYNTTGKNMAQLQGFAAQQENINKQITGFQQDQEVGYKEVEASILGVAFAHNVNTEKMKDMVLNGKDEVAQLRMMVAESINYTAALDDMKVNQDLISEGFLAGITSAEEFFNGLVKGTEQEGVFNASLAEGAEKLGITSDLFSFSSGKMQELIKTTYQASVANDALGLSASKSTAFLKDQVLIGAQVWQGMKDGTEAANDWAISNIKATAESKAFHDQLLKITRAMTGLAIPAGTTNETLQEMETTFNETHDSGLTLSQMMEDNLAPAFERVSKVFQAKSFKDMKKVLKDMELPKGFANDADDAFKGAQKAAESARKVGNAMDLLVTGDWSNHSEAFNKSMKDFGKELDNLSKVKGTDKAIDAMLMSLKKMSPEELDQHSKSIHFLSAAINDKGFLSDSAKQQFWDMWNSEVPEAGNSASTAAPKIEKLTLAMMGFQKVSNQASINGKKVQAFSVAPTIIKKPTGPEEKQIVVDNHQALAAVDVVATRINDLGKIKPQIALMNNNAFSIIQGTANAITDLTAIQPAINLQNKQAMKVITKTANAITDLTAVQPQIDLQNKQAMKVINKTANAITDLTAVKPQINLQNKQAMKVITKTANAITDLTQVEPQINLQNDDALDAISAVDKKIKALSQTVTVHVKVDGLPKGAAHGMHETLSEDTLIQAHKGERVDIQKSGLDDTSMRSLGASGNHPPPGFAGTAMGNMTVNNYIDLGGDTVVRSFKRKLGTNLYTLGR